MKLTVGDKLNDDPKNDDFERAVDGKPHDAGWHIHLQSNGDDYIEAFAEKAGRYRVSFVDRERRFIAPGPVDADALGQMP